MKKLLKTTSSFLLISCFLFFHGCNRNNNYNQQISEFHHWIKSHHSPRHGLPYSHVGDSRFENWTITYDAAVVALAYIALNKLEKAEQIIDFYINEKNAHRLGGFIEALVDDDKFIGKDWSVRTGANVWLGIASFHLYKKTQNKKYLDLSSQIADWTIDLQNQNSGDMNYGGIRLGPKGDPQHPDDQRLGHDINKLSFYDIYSTEVNIDSYTLLSFLYQETGWDKYKEACQNTFRWIKNVAYNPSLKRFNRGANDAIMSPDIHSWGISALGADGLNSIEEGLCEKIVSEIEACCVSEVLYKKEGGSSIKVKGLDFIDKQNASRLKRGVLISPEWTFQLINAYKRIADDFNSIGQLVKARKYHRRRNEMLDEMLKLVHVTSNGYGYPYATLADVPIGHEYNTPKEGNLSVIGPAYAILAIKGFDPLVYPNN